MARTRIQLRQEAQRQRIERYEASLRAARAPQTLDRSAILDAVVKGFGPQILRDPENWQARLKTRDPGRIALAAARFVFARFRVPAHLEQVWLEEEAPGSALRARRKLWYILVAQGGSLYKTCTKDFLSRRETHLFLNPPVTLDFKAALWHAVARSYTEDLGLALRLARSKIAEHDLQAQPFWREAVRFFCAQPTTLAEINDLCDYFEVRLEEDRRYSLKGRTLASLRARMTEWHRDLARVRRMGEASWDGVAMADWSHVALERGRPFFNTRLTIVQLKTARALAEEGNAQHHCVYTYKHRCISGTCSIWSLRRLVRGGFERLLTLEMNARRELVQIRGYANRLAHPEELQVLRLWFAEAGLGRIPVG